MDMAEHSRCQPGSHRPALRPFQQAPLLGVLPQREVGRVPLVRLHFHAVALAQLVQGVAGELAVAGEGGHVVVDGALGRGIGKAGVRQPLGEAEHLRDVLGGPRKAVRREDVHGGFVGVERRLVVVGDLPRGLALHPRPAITDRSPPVSRRSRMCPTSVMFFQVQHVQAVVQQRAPDEVGEQEAAQVADVGEAIDRRAAGACGSAALCPRRGLQGDHRSIGLPEAIAQAQVITDRG